MIAGFCKFIVFWALAIPWLAVAETAPAPRKAKVVKKKTVAAQWGVVSAEGAAVYKGPTFDAPITDYLEAGKKFRISRKIYRGAGGFGAFYKIRLKNNVYGYIADTEVTPEFQPDSGALGGSEGGGAKENPEFSEVEDGPQQDPIFFTRYLGAAFGFVNFSEKIDGRKFSSSTPVFGLKITGPGALLAELPLDVNVLFSGAPPDYYAKVQPGPHSGFFMLADVNFQLPFMDWRSGQIAYGLGAMLTYTRFDLRVGSEQVDNQELRAGAVLMLGVAQRLGRKWVVRGDLKYFWEKTSYLGYFLSAQFLY